MEAALDRLYPEALATPGAVGGADEGDVERLKDLASDAPVVRAVNALGESANSLNASKDRWRETARRLDAALADQIGPAV